MAVNVRLRTTTSGRTYWQADIRVRLADGLIHRERPKTPGNTRAQALRWARQREAYILRHGVEGKGRRRHGRKATPVFKDFVPRFMADYVEANRLSPMTRRHYEVVLRTHLIPVLGDMALDKIGPQHIQALKRRGLKASTTNQVLSKLKAILRTASRWGLLGEVPEITTVKVGRRHPAFYDFDAYERLVACAAELNPTTHALVLLGGDAGLRRGELRGLRWVNVHLKRDALYICDNLTFQNNVRLPKGGKTRWVPMTTPLAACLRGLERRGEHVISREDGHFLSERSFDHRLYRAQQRAGLPKKGAHILRHTFCSHLAMRGTPQRAIQELAGHAKSSTTEIYMHLAPRALQDAIRNLRG